MKRFTETNKWRDPWFRKLSAPAKQLWEYLRDNCDAIGLIEIDFALVSSDCGQKIDESHIAEIGDRAQSIGPGKFFLPKFIHFQYGELTLSCPPHRPIIALVEAHKLVRVGLHYAYPTCIENRYPNARVALPLRQDKTRQVQEKDKKEGVQGEEVLAEFPKALQTARVLAKWQIWMTHRRAHKKPKSWLVLFNEQIEWLSNFDEPTVFEILSASIRNGWQGLFEPKPTVTANGRPMTPMDYKTIIQAKEGQATAIRNQYCSETAMDQIWSDPLKRQEFFALKREIKSLNAKLGGMA